jgi:hypothetical protein
LKILNYTSENKNLFQVEPRVKRVGEEVARDGENPGPKV